VRPSTITLGGNKNAAQKIHALKNVLPDWDAEERGRICFTGRVDGRNFTVGSKAQKQVKNS
jgi:hypothetical protein